MKKYTPPVPRPTYFDKGFDVQTAHEFIQKYYPDFYMKTPCGMKNFAMAFMKR